MRLAVNGSIVDSLVTGLGVYSQNVARELANLYDDIVIYSSCQEAFPSCVHRLELISSSMGPSSGKVGHLRRLLWTQFILPRRMQRDGASVLFSPVPEGVFGSHIVQIPVVHDLTPLRFPKDYALQYFYYQCILRPLLRNSKQVIVVSNQTKSDLLRWLPIPSTKIHVVHGGCDHERFHSGINSQFVKKRYDLHSYCLYVGNMHPHKNLKVLLGAYSRLQDTIPHQLIIVGNKDSRYFPGLLGLVEKLNLSHKVKFLGYVPTMDLPGLYAGAELCVFPSLNEGFGLPLLEAMACGTPVITSKIGGPQEVIGPAGLAINPSNPEDLANAILSVLTNESLRTSLSHLGIEQAKKFSWATTAKNISRVLDECEA